MKKLLVNLHRNQHLIRDLLWLIIPAVILITLPFVLWNTINKQNEIRSRATSTEAGYAAVTWHTPDVALKADGLYVYADNLFFYTGASQAELHSDPANAGENRTTLEAIWNEDGREMRINLYFEKDESDWWIYEIRSYDGLLDNPDWIYYPPETYNTKTPLGRALRVKLDLVTAAGGPVFGRLGFGNLIVLPFLRDLPCFSLVSGTEFPVWPDGCGGVSLPGLNCTQVITPLSEEEIASYTDWLDAGSPALPCTPTLTECTPLPDCYYTQMCALRPEPGQVYCAEEEISCTGLPDGTACVSIIPCGDDPDCIEPEVLHGNCLNNTCAVLNEPPIPPTTTPTANITSTPLPSAIPATCTRGTPTVNISPRTVTAAAGATVTYSITLKNTDSAACTTPKFSATAVVPDGWTFTSQPNIAIAPGQTVTFPAIVTVKTTADAKNYIYYIDINSDVSSPYHFLRIPMSLAVVSQVQVNQTYQFRFNFDGVTGNAAETAGAKIRIHIVTPDANLVTPFLPVRYDNARKSYAVEFTNTNPLPAGQKVYFLLKGEKHAAVKFCRDNQTGPCLPSTTAETQWLTVPSGITTANWWILNFAGFPLLAGDTNQDYVIDTTDYSAIKNLLFTACSALTTEQKTRTDLNYDGCINIKDLFLVRKTLETRYDPN